MKGLKKKVGSALAVGVAVLMSMSSLAMIGCGSQTGPYIDDDGYWVVNGQKTDWKATGEKGETGATGAQGAQGEKGEQGDKGADGKNGTNGTNGTNGKDGRPGSTGWLVNGTGDEYKDSDFLAIEESNGAVNPIYGDTTYFADGNLGANGKFYTDYSDLASARAAAHELAIEIAAEGDVLLKNENNALPLKSTEKNLTLLGIRNARMIRSGFGSGAGGGSAVSTLLADSLEKQGFNINRKLLSYYTQQVNLMVEDAILELDPATYGPTRLATFNAYNDAAVLVFSRTGAENFDVATNRCAGYANPDDHKLMLDDNEHKLVLLAKERFKKVIVLINSSNIMQIPELHKYDATRDGQNNYEVDAIMWVGGVGQDGTEAIARIFTGEVNPSGHTVDLWEKDFKKGPVWTNFGTQTQNYDDQSNRMDALYYGPGGSSTYFAGVEYREDIYYGYKYYDTRYVDAKTRSITYTGDEDGYGNVLYGYGYGLSYTNFEWKLAKVETTGNITAADQTVTMRVWVKNTGNYAGKEVVQLYYSAPYTEGGIEKAAVNIAGFGKTKLLNPGESDVVTITINAQDMASFDWNDANGNGFQGYELEAGDYKLIAASNAHAAAQALVTGEVTEGLTKDGFHALDITRTVTQVESDTATKGKTGIKCTTDLVTGKEIKNVLYAEKETTKEKVYTAVKGSDGKDDITGILSHNDHRSVNVSLIDNKISRWAETGLVQPKAPSKEDRTLNAAVLADWNSQENYYSYMDKETDPWYVKAVPTAAQAVVKWTQAADDKGKITIKLSDMAGVDYLEPVLVDGVPTWNWSSDSATAAKQKENNEKWENFMNQFTWDELTQLPTRANNIFKRLADATGIGTSYSDPDGPINAASVQFPSNPIVTATYNKELALTLGEMVGNLLVLNGQYGWRGTGADIHRSPFSGRNFEYMSEDGVTAGIIAAAVTRGATSKGVIAHIKHFFGNDQEAYRADYGGVFTWATEQQIREQMAKPFEYIVKYGGTIGLMNSFNRIGKYTQSTNFAVHERLLNQEWDFKGSCEGDAWAKQFVPINLGVRGGDDELLSADSGFPPNALERGKWDATKNVVMVAKDAAQYAANGGYLGNAKDAKFELESPTHYFNVRKACQRLLQSMANSAVIQNKMANEEVTLTLTKNVYNSITLNIPGKSDDVQFTFKDVTWPKGMSYNANTGVLSGVPTEDTNADVTGTYNCDVWVTKNTKNVTFKFAMQSDLMLGTQRIVDGGELTATAAQMTSGLKIEAATLKYGAQVRYTGASNQRLMNEYSYEGKWYHRDEDKSAADIITLGEYVDTPKDIAGIKALVTAGKLDDIHLYEYTITINGEAATTSQVTYNETDELGWMGKETYKVNTSATLKGLAAGTYTIKVSLNIPYVSKGTNPWMSPRGTQKAYEVTFTLKVA